MKKIIAEVATLLGSTLLLLTALFTVVQIVMNNDIESRTFLSEMRTENINSTNETSLANGTDNDETVPNEEEQGNIEAEEAPYSTSATDEPAPIAVAASTQGLDWSALTSLDSVYSASTLIYNYSGSNQTTMEVNFTGSNKNLTWNNNSSVKTKPRIRAYENESFTLRINNCGADLNGNPFDVLITVKNVDGYRQSNGHNAPSVNDSFPRVSSATIPDQEDYDYMELRFNAIRYNDSQTNPQFKDTSSTGGHNRYDSSGTNNNSDLITFSLNANYASCDFQMQYLKHGENTKAKVTHVNGFFYDLDVPHFKSVNNSRGS